MPIPIKNGLSYPKTKIIYGDTRNKIQNQSSVSPIDFHAKTGLAVEYSISGNMTQASTQEYSITDIPPIDFQSDGNGISDYSIYGNMMQATSQQYSLTGTSPLSFKSDANTLVAWSMLGNGQQTGTPTPDAPIMPEFCGVRTGNLCNSAFELGSISSINGNNVNYTKRIRSIDSIELSSGTYTVNAAPTVSGKIVQLYIFKYDASGAYIERIPSDWTAVPYSFSLSERTKVRFTFRYSDDSLDDDGITNIMLNTGSTALPYEPYGWKIPITCAGQTTPVYLGQVSTVRKIRKLVLTGSETIGYSGNTNAPYRIAVSDIIQVSDTNAVLFVCSHYQAVPNSASWASYPSCLSWSFSGGKNLQALNFRDTACVDAAAFKSYLAAQYAAGTPVTVWYVLATPETAIVNEPLCKIGDYADELRSTDAGVTIPTTTGDNTLSIDTTLSPSSVSITTTSGVWSENPIIPEETGDLVESGEHSGQYAIPITNAGTTTNIYALEPIRKIGDYADVVNSSGAITRYVKKLVLTGAESWGYSSPNVYHTIYEMLKEYPVVCDHYKYGKGNNMITTTRGAGTSIWIQDDANAPDADAWKAYLAAQYAAGTPVCVWYVLATPTTETTTSPTISTVSGANTLSIGTTLQPSNVSLTTSSSVYPLNPIIPEEVGDRTGNLMPSANAGTYTINDVTIVCDGYGTYTIKGTASAYAQFVFNIQEFTVPISVGQGGTGTLSSFNTINTSNVTCVFYNGNTKVDDWVLTPANRTNTVYFVLGGKTVNKLIINIQTGTVLDGKFSIMLTDNGQLPSVFEPYGYKIPLNLNNTISNIYLSQPIRKIGNYSDSIDYENGVVTRNIKKLVLTGTENGREGYWSPTYYQNAFVWYNTYAAYFAATDIAFCTHFSYTAVNPEQFGKFRLRQNNVLSPARLEIGFSSEGFTDLNAFKAWLAQQYANGNPVTVYYVLSTPEVEQITPPTITPSIESNTISVDTTLQPSNLSITYTSPDYSLITKVYDNHSNLVYRDPFYYDWETIRDVVRKGLAPQYYPIGTIFYDNFNPETGTAFQVVAHNNHFDPALTAQGYTHSMTLCEVLLTDVIKFDETEAFLYTNTILPAGTYRFTIPNYDATYGGNKTYYFTSTSDLPAESQLVMNWPYNQTPKTVTAYSPSGASIAQTVTTATSGWSGLTLNEYIEGTSPTAINLGTIAGPSTQLGTSDYGEMNHIHRARYGSNNYLQSGIRQYINSNSPANTWWEPQTIFDRPYTIRTSAGKLTQLNSNLVNVMAKPEIESRTNSYFETNSLDGTTLTTSTDYDIITDRMFLLSPVEVGFSTTDTTVGTLLDYYVDATNETRIKKRKSNNTAYYWWLRTPYPSSATNVRSVGSSGALNSNIARLSTGSAAACVIQ